jgi:hypothetical protein
MAVLRPACPLAYHCRAEDLAVPPAFTCPTLYVVGGMYGNPYALDAVVARASIERSPPEIVFNGDFHYLDVDPDVFRAVEDGVRAHHAIQGNIEYALSTDDDTLGCGCDYPDYVADTVVADSNAVVAQLRTATAAAERHAWLGELARCLTVSVGEHRVGIVHGDPENLAGWKLALEAAEPQDRRSGHAPASPAHPPPPTRFATGCSARMSRRCAAPTPVCPTHWVVRRGGVGRPRRPAVRDRARPAWSSLG